jgi:hypothetical protein
MEELAFAAYLKTTPDAKLIEDFDASDDESKFKIYKYLVLFLRGEKKSPIENEQQKRQTLFQKTN